MASVAALGLKDETLYGTLLVTSAHWQPFILLQSVSHSLWVMTPLLSALVTLKSLSCHTAGSLTPPTTWLLPTTTWSAHFHLHQKGFGCPVRHRSQASGTCCWYSHNHSGEHLSEPPPHLLLRSPPLRQLPRLPAYLRCGFGSLSSHVAIFCTAAVALCCLCYFFPRVTSSACSTGSREEGAKRGGGGL